MPNVDRATYSLFLFILLVCLVASTPGCKKKKPFVMPKPPTVQVMKAIQHDVPIYREWIGTLTGTVNAEVRAQVTGYLASQNYKDGDTVKRGELLFTIDPRPFQSALDQAKANLDRAKAAACKAQLDEKRNLRLYGRSVISAQERDQAVENAQTTCADVLSQQAAYDTAKINLGFTNIRSPLDGVAAIATAQIGDLVGTGNGSPLTAVSVIDPIKAFVTVSEQAYIEFTQRYVTMASRAMKEDDLRMELILANGNVVPYPGRFYAMDLSIDPSTGALRFAGLFSNPNRALRPGLFCRVRALTETRKAALLVPQRAVTELQGLQQVAVVTAEGKISIRNVSMGERIGMLWLVDKGLNPGDTVVVEGLQRIKEGAVVTIENWTEPPGLRDGLTPRPLPKGPLPEIPPSLLNPPTSHLTTPLGSPDTECLPPAPATPPSRQQVPAYEREPK